MFNVNDILIILGGGTCWNEGSLWVNAAINPMLWNELKYPKIIFMHILFERFADHNTEFGGNEIIYTYILKSDMEK